MGDGRGSGWVSGFKAGVMDLGDGWSPPPFSAASIHLAYPAELGGSGANQDCPQL